MYLEKATEHIVFDGENVGLALGLELARQERRVERISAFVDNKAALQAVGGVHARPGHHLTDVVLKQIDRLFHRHPRARLTLRWIPAHVGVPGNEAVDIQAKAAAHRRPDPPRMKALPRELREPPPVSVAAHRQHTMAGIKCEALHRRRLSPRYARVSRIDPPLPSDKFLKMAGASPKKHTSQLVQLRSGHAPLNGHLNRLGMSDSARCSCGTDDETVLHYILRCPKWKRARAPLRRAFPPSSLQLRTLLNDREALPLLFDIKLTGRFAAGGNDRNPPG